METPVCPDCGHRSLRLGPIPATPLFAGVIHENAIPGGALWRCIECRLAFRFPRLSKEALDGMYVNGEELNWAAPTGQRRDWTYARQLIQQHTIGQAKILDVGCFDGRFLAPLTGQHQCKGIEIHPEASARAKLAGVEIVGRDFLEIDSKYDFITAFDVIEHMTSPLEFVEKCKDSLNPGGYLLVSTGNLDSPSFQLLGSRYWYCTIAEHISFVSPAWFKKIGKSNGLAVDLIYLFAHNQKGLRGRMRQTLLNLLYWAFPRAFAASRKAGAGGIKISDPALVNHPPTWDTAQDHFLVLMRKT